MDSHVAVPQADDLDKIFGVVDIIAAGTNDATSIADRLGVVARQGHYYLAAAEQLGLVRRDISHRDLNHPTETNAWALTQEGKMFHVADSDARAFKRGAIVMHAPIIKHLAGRLGVKRPRVPNHVHLFEDEKFVSDAIEEMGYAPETAFRRALTIKAWMKGLS